MNNTYFIETTDPLCIKQQYYYAIEQGCLYFRAKGSKGFYGWDATNNIHIAIAADGSECQELSTGKIILLDNAIKSIAENAIIEPQIDYKTLAEELKLKNTELENSNANLIADADRHANILLENDKIKNEMSARIEELESKLNASNKEIERLTNLALTEIEDEKNRVLSIDEFLERGVSLPSGAGMKIEIKKEYESAYEVKDDV